MADKDPPNPTFRLPDPALVSRTMADVAERGQRIVSDFLKRQAGESPTRIRSRSAMPSSR